MNIWYRKQLLIRVLMLIKLIKLLFSAGSVAAWSDWRRFDIPKLEVGPVCTTIDHIPYRHQFDSEIYQGNLENYEAAVKADLNGDDSREQRVWWNRR